jgi:hypothetical protein
MNHKEAIGAAIDAFTRDYKIPLPIQIQKAVEAYLAARDCVLMPRELDEGMLAVSRDWSQRKYGKPIGNDAAIGHWAALIAEIDRREREEGK